jgi:signal transduction histidine kinase
MCEEWQALALDEIVEAAVVHDHERRIVHVNAAACELLKVPRALLLGRRVDEFVTPPPGGTTDEMFAEFIDQRGRAFGRVCLSPGDGARTVVEYRVKANILPGLHLLVFCDVSDQVVATLRAERLQQMSARLVENPSPRAVFEVVIRQGLKDLGVRSGWLGVLDETGTKITDIHYVGAQEAQEDPLEAAFATWLHVLPIQCDLPVPEAIRERRAIYVSTRDELQARWPMMTQCIAAQACAAVPMVLRGNAAGALAFLYEEPRAFDRAERAFLQGAAQICAAAVDRAAAQRALQDSENAQRFLADAGVAFAQSLDEAKTLKTVADVATRAFADWCLLDVLEPGTGALRCAAVGHRDSNDAARAERARLAARLEVGGPDYLAMRAIEAGEPLLVRDSDEAYWKKAATSDEHLEVIRAIGPRSILCVPLRARGGRLGTLTLLRCDPKRPFEEREMSVAVEFGRRSAMAVENARLYAAAQRDRAAAEEASRTKDQFLAVLGHELRNPLAPIVTALRFMAIRGADPYPKERAIINRQVEHLTRLVDDLLDVSRITRGQLELRRQPLEITDALCKAIEITGPALEERRHRLVTDFPPVSPRVFGDAARLTQVFSNLLTNAARFTPPEGTIRVAARAEGELVVVSVEDTGIGIAPALLPRVFDAFVQGRRSEAVRGGLGLGLAIVRSLTELHGGRVSAASRETGQGTKFVVELPLLKGPTADNAVEGPPCKASSSGVGLRVLIVDDNVDAAEILGEALAAMGQQVKVLADGPSALEMAAHWRPQVALLDIGLPVMDGYEVARRLTAIPGCERTRLIAVTGYGQESDRERSRQAGFDEHLVKPVDLDQLMRAAAGSPPPN